METDKDNKSLNSYFLQREYPEFGIKNKQTKKQYMKVWIYSILDQRLKVMVVIV